MPYFHSTSEPVYTIGVAARLLEVTPQFLRQIESEGLITPARTDTNMRLYSEDDLKLLARIIYLWRDCKINPQGIRVIMEMEQIDLESRSSDEYEPRSSDTSEAKERNEEKVR
ncbi:MAG: MerR family transcriptional regulator [Bacillota bacterium]|nr:MerR family transcriptional regulator [Bacillota bacterium]